MVGPMIEQEVQVTETECQHHWVIEAPQGVTSRGICKRCGSEREFRNSVSEAVWDNTPSTEASAGRWNRAGIINIARDDFSDDS